MLRGGDSTVLGDKQGKTAPGTQQPYPLTPSGETIGAVTLNSLGVMCAFVPRGLAALAPSEIAPYK